MDTNEQENNRNPDGTFKPGHSGNPNGRPKNTLKAFLAREFPEMDDDQKREWLEKHKISGEVMWKMAEGNPQNESKVEAQLHHSVNKEEIRKALDDII